MEETCDVTLIERFIRSPEGHAWLRAIRDHLEGRRIQWVAFAATDTGIATTLHLDNNELYRFMDEELMLETLQEQFSSLFRRMTANTIETQPQENESHEQSSLPE